MTVDVVARCVGLPLARHDRGLIAPSQTGPELVLTEATAVHGMCLDLVTLRT